MRNLLGGGRVPAETGDDVARGFGPLEGVSAAVDGHGRAGVVLNPVGVVVVTSLAAAGRGVGRAVDGGSRAGASAGIDSGGVRGGGISSACISGSTRIGRGTGISRLAVTSDRDAGDALRGSGGGVGGGSRRLAVLGDGDAGDIGAAGCLALALALVPSTDLTTSLTTLAPVLTLGGRCGQRSCGQRRGEEDVLEGNHFG
jgi:hypothetical protein